MQPQTKLIDGLLERAKDGDRRNINYDDFMSYFYEAYRIRKIEHKFLELFSKAKINGTIHTCVGQEFSGIAVCDSLNENDWVTSNHRCHGHFIAKTGDWRGLIDELMGLRSGVSSGVGSSQHLFKSKFISNGTQGSLLPVGTGIALANKNSANNGIVVSFIGEGTLGEGVCYEALNLSGVFSSPQLFVCENNYYSQSTGQAQALSGTISARAKAFGMKYFDCCIWDTVSLFKTCKEAVSYVRQNKAPAFLKIDTYRLLAHSKGDDDRDRAEVEEFNYLDPLNKFLRNFENNKLTRSVDAEIDNYCGEKLVSQDILDYRIYCEDQLPRSVSMKTQRVLNEEFLLVKALSRAYRKQLVEKDAIFVGEDIADPYGGAFKVTKGFQEMRPQNVFSTSISEAGLVGLAIGMNLTGKHTYAEIMFGDFVLNAMDQLINNASKFHHMYGKQFSCDIVLRTPMGARRGYGPTHSQSLEKFLLGIDNTLVCAVTSLHDPIDLIDGLTTQKCPKIIIENKTDYANSLFRGSDGLVLDRIGGQLGTLKLSPYGTKPTFALVAYGYLARLIADNYKYIFQKTDTTFYLLCPQLLHPLPIGHLEHTTKHCSNVLILEDGTEGFGWADGVLSQLINSGVKSRVRTLSSDPVPVPSNKALENNNIVSLNKIIKKINEMRSY